MAGCILVDGEKLQVINRSPAYKNQYVHRRDSMSLATLSSSEIAKRMRLGLVTAPTVDSSDDDEEWDDFESSEGEDEVDLEEHQQKYTFAQNRRSSINLLQMNENYHDSQSNPDWEAGNQVPRNAYTGASGSMASMEMSGFLDGSSRLVRETINEAATDEDASTVDGEA